MRDWALSASAELRHDLKPHVSTFFDMDGAEFVRLAKEASQSDTLYCERLRDQDRSNCTSQDIIYDDKGVIAGADDWTLNSISCFADVLRDLDGKIVLDDLDAEAVDGFFSEESYQHVRKDFDKEDPISSVARSAVDIAVIRDQQLSDYVDDEGRVFTREVRPTDGDNVAKVASSDVEAEWLRRTHVLTEQTQSLLQHNCDIVRTRARDWNSLIWLDTTDLEM